MAVITISRQFGAGGITLGKLLAQRLEYTFADTEIIKMVAKMANVSPSFVDTVEKEAGGKFSKIISKLVSKPLVERVLKSDHGYIDEEIYLDYLVLIIAKLADENDVVIIGRGSQYILNDHPDAYHILLIDTLENRVNHMEKYFKLSRSKAAQVVKNEDKRRINLYRKLNKTDYDNPCHYHLVMNMSRISMDKAAQLVLNLMEK